MPKTVLLKNGACEAVVSSLGAELFSWRMDGRELIWNGDARWWPRRAPTLFPFCGWLKNGAFRAKGKEYATDVHGFGRDTHFILEKTGDASATLMLVDSEATRRLFPFAFGVSVSVTAEPNGVTFSYLVKNPGHEPLPYSLGFHPGFVWPFDGGAEEDYELEFSVEETPVVPAIVPGGLFTDKNLELPWKGRRLNPATALKLQESLCLMNTLSKSVDFIAPSGRRIRCQSENFPHWVIWRKPGGAYLCIERWAGQGDPVDFSGDITEKPGIRLLPPNQRDSYSFRCSFE